MRYTVEEVLDMRDVLAKVIKAQTDKNPYEAGNMADYLLRSHLIDEEELWKHGDELRKIREGSTV